MPRRSSARGWSRSPCRCTPPSAWASAWPSASARLNPGLPSRFYGLYATLNADYLLAAWRRQRHRRRGRGAAGRSRRRARSRDGRRPLPGVRRAGELAARTSRGSRCPPPSRAAPAVAEDLRAARARRPPVAGRLRRGQPRLPPSLPPLPHPAGLRRPLLRRARRRGAGRRAPAGRGGRRRTSPSATPTSSTGPATRSRWRGTPRRVPAADLRLHRQGRASPAAPRPPARAGGARRLFVVSAVESLCDTVLATSTRATPARTWTRRWPPRARPASRSAPPGCLHPVDHARGLPRACWTSSRPTG